MMEIVTNWKYLDIIIIYFLHFCENAENFQTYKKVSDIQL